MVRQLSPETAKEIITEEIGKDSLKAFFHLGESSKAHEWEEGRGTYGRTNAQEAKRKTAFDEA